LMATLVTVDLIWNVNTCSELYTYITLRVLCCKGYREPYIWLLTVKLKKFNLIQMI
jgi:hypothetical protein